jgi:hypothetical protein
MLLEAAGITNILVDPWHAHLVADWPGEVALDSGAYAIFKGRAVSTQHKLERPLLHLGPLAFDALDFQQLHSFIGDAYRFSMALGTRFADAGMGKASQQRSGLSKGHPSAEVGQMVLKQWSETTRE